MVMLMMTMTVSEVHHIHIITYYRRQGDGGSPFVIMNDVCIYILIFLLGFDALLLFFSFMWKKELCRAIVCPS